MGPCDKTDGGHCATLSGIDERPSQMGCERHVHRSGWSQDDMPVEIE
jgi:hypothetical protein